MMVLFKADNSGFAQSKSIFQVTDSKRTMLSEHRFAYRFKRAIDILGSVLGLLLLSPLMIVIGLAILFTMGRPILFRQERPGYYERPFILLKFRTMKNTSNSNGKVLSDFERLTGFGRFLRKTSIDELPELLNVLKGDMSLVGPRPLLMEYLKRYNPEQSRRHNVKPGITGWAQINGRNAITWEQKFEFDVWYVDHQSIWFDIKILCLTMIKVIRHESINAPGETTMPLFMGPKKR